MDGARSQGLVPSIFLSLRWANLALVPASNVVCALAFAGGTQFNFVAGWACAILSTVVAAVVTYLFGFEKDSEAFVEDAE